MREIKFRGKRVKDGKWLYGYLLTIQRNDGIHYHINGTNSNCRVIPETVGQYIGSKDKNGREIYEGDIFAPIPFDDVPETVVTYDEYYAGFIAEHSTDEFFENIDSYNWEVIGNIHDNPDLLEGKYE